MIAQFSAYVSRPIYPENAHERLVMLPIQLSIVAANDLVRNGIESIINQAAQSIQIESVFASLAECERQLKRQSVHILLLDDALPCNYKPFQLVNRLMNRYPLTKIAILSNCLNDYYVQGVTLHSKRDGIIQIK